MLRPHHLPNSSGYIPTSESGDICYVVDFKPWQLIRLSEGQFSNRLVWEEANLLDFEGARLCSKNCIIWA